MSALSDFADALTAIKNYIPAYTAAQAALAAKYSAIDPSADDAQAQFDALTPEREALRSNTSYGLAGLVALIESSNKLYPAAYAEDPTAANAIRAEIKSIVDATAGTVTNAAKEAQTAITAAAKKAAIDANAPTGEPDPNNINGTPAGDDNSYDKAEAARLSNYSNPNTAAGSEKADIINKASTSTTQAGAAGSGTGFTDTAVKTGPKPGTRLQNPLGNFSSYTYQLSLYMITPDAYDAFVQSGRKNINALSASDSNGNPTGGGAFLVAQSGGINNKTSKRAPGFELDFYIDNLKIKTKTSSKSTQTASNSTEFTFDIKEPMGFSFITKLKRGFDLIKKQSKLKNYDKAAVSSKQFFILGIRFQGYDKNGEIANASKYFSDDTFNTSPDSSGVFERFYDLQINSIKFKLQGGATTYACTGVNLGTSVGMSIARGIVDNNTPITADTVLNALGPNSAPGTISLFDAINAGQQKLQAAGTIEIANVYKIEWQGSSDMIKSAVLKSDADLDKKKQQMSPATKSSEVNDATAFKAVTDSSKIQFSIPKGTPIPQAIKNVIMHSSYLEQALTAIYTTAEENNPETDAPEAIKQKDPPPLKWYNLSTRIKCLGFDTKINDFAYEITYVIQPYETPAITSPYGKASKYYGPHKRYEYWFTGKNSEIISYEQSLDNTFQNVALNPDGDPQSQGNGNGVATMVNKQTNQERTGRDGKGNEAQNTYMTSLFDPGAWNSMKMTILGDPDYLTSETPESANELYQQFYKQDGFTINPNGGQVFVEVSFNEAIDYDNEKGVMSVNDSIYFINYPPEVAAKIKGISYTLLEVESIFSKGKFTQVLSGVANEIPASAAKAAGKDGANQTDATSQRTGADLTNSSAGGGRGSAADPRRVDTSSGTNVTGLVPDAPVGSDNYYKNAPDESSAETARLNRSSAQQTIPTNNPATPRVQDDDAAVQASATQAGQAMSAEDAQRAGA